VGYDQPRSLRLCVRLNEGVIQIEQYGPRKHREVPSRLTGTATQCAGSRHQAVTTRHFIAPFRGGA
jgi:hypothetical protein